MKTLDTPSEEQFKQDGYVLVPHAFDPGLSEPVCRFFFDEWGVDPADRNTWQTGKTLIQKSLELPELYTDRVTGALDDLVGEGRYPLPTGTGYILGSLPGFREKPWGIDGGHMDGAHFHHHIHSREQALILLFLFTDVDPEGGGTWIAPGSHHVTARALNEAVPDGLAPGDLAKQVRTQLDLRPERMIEATGRAGDVLLMHPFVYHGSSTNTNDRIRVASNVCVSAHEPLRVDGNTPYTALSPVEQAIIDELKPATA
ncbi:MAG: phytanoyl-CoA dioxygenase family protein [Opitutales bacterium]